MEYMINHWATILIVVIIGLKIGWDIAHFFDMPTEEKVAKIKGWLLQAVIMAEKEYGSGTGALKLSVVYAEFCEQLPWLAKMITFDTFSKYVDDVLESMRSMLESNKNIAQLVEDDRE